ncbi:MAG: hypothetical protein J2P41_09615 [Blastocatellia bacterium]|nr:hypothetical protein [Blastocatellia bacterium]
MIVAPTTPNYPKISLFDLERANIDAGQAWAAEHAAADELAAQLCWGFDLAAVKAVWLVDDPKPIARKLVGHGLIEPVRQRAIPDARPAGRACETLVFGVAFA